MKRRRPISGFDPRFGSGRPASTASPHDPDKLRPIDVNKKYGPRGDPRLPGHQKPKGSAQLQPSSRPEQLQPAPVSAPPAKKKKTPAKKGAKERPEWKEIVPYLKASFETGELPNSNAAYHAISNWLVAKKLTMARSTIQAGIKRHCADWWE